MSSSKGFYDGNRGGDVDFRRKWDRDEYEKKAKEREEREKERDKDEERRAKGLKPRSSAASEPTAPRDLLKARDYKIDLSANLNKTQVVQASSVASKQPGFYCEVCDCTVKDSVNYLDHINGRKHQRNLNVSMKVERSTADQVRARLEALKKAAENPEEEYDLDARLEKRKREEEDEKASKKEKKKEKKKQKKEASEKAQKEFIDEDIAAAMGFGGFGTSKK
ncbi:zinc finger, matrin-type 2 [Quaeritorhiza haematococci]|nr:zinc finger, matrin-type 2 [Quaeritorhiza haematococci]